MEPFYYGPVPVEHDVLLAYMQANGVIELKPYDGDYEGEYIEPVKQFNPDLFTPDELKIMTDVAERFADCRATDMTYISHAEEAYEMTDMKETIPYDFAMHLKACR
jgi:hypothetical protein